MDLFHRKSDRERERDSFFSHISSLGKGAQKVFYLRTRFSTSCRGGEKEGGGLFLPDHRQKEVEEHLRNR